MLEADELFLKCRAAYVMEILQQACLYTSSTVSVVAYDMLALGSGGEKDPVRSDSM